MKIDRELVDKLAMLSRLKLGEDEKQKMLKDLNKILELVDQLNELDTSEVDPLLHMTDQIPPMRTDAVRQTESKQDILSNAPLKDHNFFKVPKVVKK